MKKLIVTAAMFLSQVAMAQTGITEDTQLGTVLWTIQDQSPYVNSIKIYHGDTQDELLNSVTVQGLEAYQVQAIEGEVIETGEVAYKIPLLSDTMPFQVGDKKFFQVTQAFIQEGSEIESVPSEVIQGFLLVRPKKVRKIGIGN